MKKNNITQKQITDQFFKSDKIFEAVLNSSNDGILIADSKSKKFKLANTRMSEMLGYTLTELKNLTVSDIHPVEDYQTVLGEFNKASNLRKHHIRNIPVKKKDGSILYADISTYCVGVNGKRLIAGTFRDVTDLKKIEDRILQSKHDWEGIFNAIPDMITIHNSDFDIVKANNSARNFLRLPSVEKKTVKCFKYYHGTDKSPNGCPSCKCLETGKPAVFEYFEPYLNKHLEIRVIPRFDDNNNFIGLIHIVRDITARRKTEEELNNRAEDLTNLNTALSVLLRHRENDKAELEEKILKNIDILVKPYIEELKKIDLKPQESDYLRIMDSNLNAVISPFSVKLSSSYHHLTPTEIRIANLVKEGEKSKNIAELLNISFETVNCHRQNIRKKLGIQNRNINLRSYLLSMS